jgi:hypothetical protein
MKIGVRIFDIIIILAVAGLTVFAFFIAYMRPQGKSQVLIRGDAGEWVYPINAEEIIVLRGPIGDTTVRIHGNSAWIESSPCDNYTCTAVGSVSKQGEWAACLPNNVLLIIHGIDDGVDGLTW